jgi:hypothetical protein
LRREAKAIQMTRGRPVSSQGHAQNGQLSDPDRCPSKGYPLTVEAKGTLTGADYRVEKMKFAKKGDKTTVIYNHRITLKGIPEAAWDYVVNGKAALDWVMERQAVRTDKASGMS